MSASPFGLIGAGPHVSVGKLVTLALDDSTSVGWQHAVDRLEIRSHGHAVTGSQVLPSSTAPHERSGIGGGGAAASALTPESARY